MEVDAIKTVHIILEEDEAKELVALIGQTKQKSNKMSKLWELLSTALYGEEQ